MVSGFRVEETLNLKPLSPKPLKHDTNYGLGGESFVIWGLGVQGFRDPLGPSFSLGIWLSFSSVQG